MNFFSFQASCIVGAGGGLNWRAVHKGKEAVQRGPGKIRSATSGTT